MGWDQASLTADPGEALGDDGLPPRRWRGSRSTWLPGFSLLTIVSSSSPITTNGMRSAYLGCEYESLRVEEVVHWPTSCSASGRLRFTGQGARAPASPVPQGQEVRS